ncbi:MAG: hypothetical protein LIR46_07505 [Bacteroidota bacterium]|nr:hypothetical protein [Bacteroidota bacterium]
MPKDSYRKTLDFLTENNESNNGHPGVVNLPNIHYAYLTNVQNMMNLSQVETCFNE